MKEEILKQIKEKQLELQALNASLMKNACEEFSYLIGKYFMPAASCCIYVRSIAYADEDCVCVNCINVNGGKYTRGGLSIDLQDSYEIRFYNIDSIVEITKDKFNEFVNGNIELSKNTITKVIG